MSNVHLRSNIWRGQAGCIPPFRCRSAPLADFTQWEPFGGQPAWLKTAGTGLFIVYNRVQGIGTLTGPLGHSLYLRFTRQVNVFGG